MKVSVIEDKLVCKWDIAWENWDELQMDPDIKALFDRASDLLGKRQTAGKGKSKGETAK